MPVSIATLPLEVLFSIVSHLNLEDFVNLGRTCGEILGEVLHDERINKEIVKVCCQPIPPAKPPNDNDGVFIELPGLPDESMLPPLSQVQ